MTAFARGGASFKGKQWSVEIRCVNHRFMEFSLKSPSWLLSQEDQIKEWVASELCRGKISLSISVQRQKGEVGKFSIDEEMLDFYAKSSKKINKKYGLDQELNVYQLLTLPKVIVSSEIEEEDFGSIQNIKRLISNVLKEVVQARKVEGEKLAADMRQRLKFIQQTLLTVEKQADDAEKNTYERLKQRVCKILSDENISIDQDRICKEVAILCDKSDITEEIVRLKSHLSLFVKKLNSTTEVGRELDFLCQEMNREINTIGSKSQHLQISTSVIDMKKELEKIREQVQNIE